MKIGIYTNPKRDVDGHCTSKVVEECKNVGVECVLLDNTPEFIYKVGSSKLDKDLENVDIVVTIGGDGTILEIGKKCAKYSKPIIGVNTGELGFLSEVLPENIYNMLNDLKNNSYHIQKRSILEVSVEGEAYYAMNEVAFVRSIENSVCKISVSVDGENAMNICGDGVIVSTPTGSTAYSLSCGGPILAPDLDVAVVVAICPHTLQARPIVVNGKSKILLKSEQKGLKVTIDGKFIQNQGEISEISVVKSQKTIDFIKLKNENFYDRLLQKLHNWTR